MAEVKNLVKFIRGIKANYKNVNPNTNAVYFATDTHELLMGGASYGVSTEMSDLINKKIEFVEYNESTGVITFKKTSKDLQPITITLPDATKSKKGLMTTTQVTELEDYTKNKQSFKNIADQKANYDRWLTQETNFDTFFKKMGGYDTWKKKEGQHDALWAKKTDYDAVATAKADYDKFVQSKGQKKGLATLDEGGKVPASQLPSYVDDVVEAANKGALPKKGESGKIYVTLDDNKTYRWGGSAYVEISASLALGESESTAYAGSKGKKNAEDIAALKVVDTEIKSRISTLEAAKTKNDTDITNLKSADTNIKKDVAKNASDITALKNGSEETIASLASKISANTGNITKNTSGVSTNKKAIEDEANRADTEEKRIVGLIESEANTREEADTAMSKKVNGIETTVNGHTTSLNNKVEKSAYNTKVEELEQADTTNLQASKTYADGLLTWHEQA